MAGKVSLRGPRVDIELPGKASTRATFNPNLEPSSCGTTADIAPQRRRGLLDYVFLFVRAILPTGFPAQVVPDIPDFFDGNSQQTSTPDRRMMAKLSSVQKAAHPAFNKIA